MKDLAPKADRWWRQARSDFELLAVIREAGKFDTCAFLAQQTAEKALKAYLFAQGEELIFTPGRPWVPAPSHDKSAAASVCRARSVRAPENTASAWQQVRRGDQYY